MSSIETNQNSIDSPKDIQEIREDVINDINKENKEEYQDKSLQ